jgi:Na+/melibiose symporter-like transporter
MPAILPLVTASPPLGLLEGCGSISSQMWDISSGQAPLWAIGVMILSAALFGLATNLTMAVTGAAIAGAGLGGVKVCREMILARLVDRSLERTDHRQEGIYYSLNRFIGQLSKLLEALA